jgi:NUMOD3 motif
VYVFRTIDDKMATTATATDSKRRRTISEEHKKRMSLLKKGVKRTEQEKRNMRLGQQNSVKYQRYLQECGRVRELKQQAKDEKKKQLEAGRLHKIVLHIYFNSLKVGPSFSHTRDGVRRISEANKGKTPWNKGVEAWNKNRKWPVEVKQNISRGMVLYWMIRKKQTATTDLLP